MFRGILTQNETKRNEDMQRLKVLLKWFEENLMLSTTDYFFSSKNASMIDFYFVPHVLRLFYLYESSLYTLNSIFEEWMWFMKEFRFLNKWVNKLKEKYPPCLARKEDFLAMIKEFQKSGKWGLYLPLAKL